ncbi:PREDICTED: uncharacterized protein LOC109230397 [Nicotiana attenuata]|uniref:WRC domain-containing protein n=1 Tax=Nicotiana attenuata TaxID=49451 RepID=A0A1J6IMJ6_NICAT|nr:PREDICTED: uncharacterized protein LOC109230397 [Nicotiana attenuata]OIT00091.1 hypothetical protein A4A49_06157 [Nicotiana attenuata]
MRIRKHAKISPLLYSSSFLKQQVPVHVCQLNQSPWDVITFPLEQDEENDNPEINQFLLRPPPPSSSYQLDGYDSYAVNGTSYDSELSITSMKLEDDERETKKEMDCSKWDYFGNNVGDVTGDFVKFENEFEEEQHDQEMEELLGLEKDGDNIITTLCCKDDGKGWQCSRETKKGHNLCEHHIAQVKKQYSDSAQSTSKLTAAAAETSSSRGRPHRPKKSSSSEFYYYSGFGPLWGKKRSHAKTDPATSDSHGAQYSSSSQMDTEGFDYVEDEDDEDEENGKIKRARKPIKARSLKSLM